MNHGELKMGIITVRPGETVTVVGVAATAPIIPPGPVDPGYSPPWAQLPGVPGPGGPVDPGYSPPWATPAPPRPTHPIALPGDPWWGGGGPVDPGYSPPWAQVPVEPPTEPPPVKPPSDAGKWVWAWSPQLGRWVWVKVPGEGEAGPKVA